MYQPAHGKFVESRPDTLRQLIRHYPLGTLITRRDDDIRVDHAPFLLDETNTGVLSAHLPRANTTWQGLDGQTVTIIFHGPNAYISPSWYPSKHAHGKAVPTWNYAIVHVQGIAKIQDNSEWLRDHIEQLTDEHEKRFSHAWKVSDAPTDYIDNMIRAIVGVEVTITNIEGKFKLGQNRSESDRMGIMAGLTASDSPLAEFIRALKS